MTLYLRQMGCLLALIFTAPAISAEAVSSINGKVDTIYGNVDGKEAKLAAGSFTTPLPLNLGLQLDALNGTVGSNHVDGFAGHLFWRNPAVGLFGVTGSTTEYRSNTLERVGVEAEYYLNKFTLAGAHGRQTGDTSHSDYHRLQLTYYPTENLALTVGGSRDIHRDKIALDLEYQTPVNGLALFVNSSRGQSGYDHTVAGLRYYFGQRKSLLKRHREDDPLNPLITISSGFAQHIERREVLKQAFLARLKSEFEAELNAPVTLDISDFTFPTNDFTDAFGDIVATPESSEGDDSPVTYQISGVTLVWSLIEFTDVPTIIGEPTTIIQGNALSGSIGGIDYSSE